MQIEKFADDLESIEVDMQEKLGLTGTNETGLEDIANQCIPQLG